jgi:F-type H+-transporting ATPase subunit b
VIAAARTAAVALALTAAFAGGALASPEPEGVGHGPADEKMDAHSDEGHSPGHVPHINWMDWDYKEEGKAPPFGMALVNFAIFMFVLIKFAGPKLSAFLRDRHIAIKSALDEGARLREEARQKLEDYRRRLAGLDAEVDKVLAEIRTQAETERQRILAHAEAQAAALQRDAEERIAAETARARRALEQEVVTAAIAAAERLLRTGTRDDDQRRLVDNFIAGVESRRTEAPR